MDEPSPIIITFVSGKGGVGKTMLAVAFARELSRQSKTLLVDLDFFNRGLTGLMPDGRRICEVEAPPFLSMPGLPESAIRSSGEWAITEVADNLYHVDYPDLSNTHMHEFATLGVTKLREGLESFIREAAQAADCDCVVLDCHGGPDNSSFAACMAADHSLLISEPDRITFYGTLNFVRQIRAASPGAAVDLRLVFNKVVPAFSGLFLQSFYNRSVRQEFGDRPLMGIFPLEVYLTKEFEKTPFLTSAYPYSLLAKKTRVMARELLATNHQALLHRAIRSIPAVVRWFQRLTLGKPTPVLDLELCTLTIGVGLLLFGILAFLSDRPGLTNELYRPVRDFSPVLLSIAGVWLAAVLLSRWSLGLERRYTYYSRVGRVGRSFAMWILCVGLWGFPMFILGALAGFVIDSHFDPGGTSMETAALLIVLGGLAVVLLAATVQQLYRAYRNLRYYLRVREALLRLGFVVMSFLMLYVGSLQLP